MMPSGSHALRAVAVKRPVLLHSVAGHETRRCNNDLSIVSIVCNPSTTSLFNWSEWFRCEAGKDAFTKKYY